MKQSEGFRCPGQNTMFWKPTDIYDIQCPKCGTKVEFWKDDARRTCPECGHQFYNPHLDLGCAEWCKYADKCVPDLVKNIDRAALYKKRLLEQVKYALRDDGQMFERAQKALELAEDASKEAQISPKAPLTAAALYFVVQRDQESGIAPFNEAKRIMRVLHTEEEVEKAALRMIKGLLGGRKIETSAFDVVHRAVNEA